MQANLSQVPNYLSTRRNWILWRNEKRGDAETKVPYSILGTPASSTDPATWTSFDDIREAYETSRGDYSGVGFVFAENGGIVGIDLDGCRNPETGEWAEWARLIVKQLDTYTELSPSGTGCKLFLLGKSPLPAGKNRKIDVPKICEAKDPGIEIYDKGRYFAVTGLTLKGTPKEPQERQAELDLFCRTWFPQLPARQEIQFNPNAVVDRARKYLAKIPPAVSGQNGHGATFHAACVLVLDFALSINEAMPVLQEWNQSCQPPWSDRELMHKLEDADKQPGERGRLREMQEQRWQTYKVPERKPPTPLPQHITLYDAALEHLEKRKTGACGLMSLGVGDVDTAISGGVEQAELIAVGAKSSHGKSAFALQSCYSVAGEGKPVLIISEEMSRLALGKRAIQFASDIHEEKWTVCEDAVKAMLSWHFKDRAPIYILESVGTTERAERAVKRYVEEHGVKYVVVDYGQMLQSPGKSRYEQTSATSSAMRRIVNETQVTLMCLLQFNRELEKRDKFIPRNADIRDSGQWEHDADVILHLVWPWKIDQTKPKDQYLVFVGKCRNRDIKSRTIDCKFDPSRQMISLAMPDFPTFAEAAANNDF